MDGWGSKRCPSPARGQHFPTVEFVVGINPTLCKRHRCIPPPPLTTTSVCTFPCLSPMSVSIPRLAFSFLVILVLLAFFKPHWIPPKVLVYIQRKWTTSGCLSALIDEMEELELVLSDPSIIPESLPEDVRQRAAKLPGHLRK